MFGQLTIEEETRLGTQMAAVYKIMRDGQWHTPPEIMARVVGGTAAITARIRDLRKEKFGGFTIERDYIERGLYRYRMIDPVEDLM
jgi:hypothetical protein